MPRSPLEGIIYQHVVYGAGTILTGRSNIRDASIQPDELEAAIAHAKPLFDAHDRDAHDRDARNRDAQDQESSERSEYDLERGRSDLRQILDVYNATVIDGRYIDELATDPKICASRSCQHSTG